ncbi:AHL_G0013900.mRNA.1.CDS.1 [Saccharomyces cerevisiae]|nr:CPG_1a_G0013880.mRNA.1.CDS.1 [Saccharomyces cerevisiae]CAI4410141.1 AIE_G0013920.mRNA.1.CDS.1 [Saccharomyces cerevisiae]CAI4414479.1 AVB_G0013600.mRNA.1.CDS.1 [Saccharomyces cerevisiae]CAI4877737.1 AHL_G0013900.mRNA.1.CDS.1 [Saccharomyces cerevisiae]CAI6614101.1 AIE_G0013920.mRNA.1.CDS.1 [Saccharomyces cerevisiae]
MNGTKIEDGENIALLSSGRLASQSTFILPKDVFRNRLTWLCYETRNSLGFCIWLLLWLPLVVWWGMSSTWIYPFMGSAILFSGLLILPAIQILCHKYALSNQLTQLSKEIIKSTPGAFSGDWDTVALHFNSYLYENNAWNTGQFFFNGTDCQEAFRKTILEPVVLRRENEGARFTSFEVSGFHIEKAVQVYFTKVHEQWKLIHTEKECSPSGLENVKLPKETYRCKLAWIFQRIVTFYFPIKFLSDLNDICFSKFFGPLLGFLYLGYLFYIRVEDFQNTRPKSMRVENKMQYLSNIINEQGAGTEGWDNIARKTNRWFLEKKVWKNEGFFFDGADCQAFFERNFSSLLFSKKSVSPRSLNVELWQYIQEAQLASHYELLP